MDECHLVVTSHSWRPNLVMVEELIAAGAPMVMLTATLPIYMESDLRRCWALELGMMSYIHGATLRKGIRYSVRQDMKSGELQEETARVWNEAASELRGDEKVVIY